MWCSRDGYPRTSVDPPLHSPRVTALRLLLLACEVGRRPLLALRLERSVGDQFADRQREHLGGSPDLLVDLLDTQTGILGYERQEPGAQFVELGLRTFLAVGVTEVAALAESAFERVDGSTARELGDLHDEVGDHAIHLRLEIIHRTKCIAQSTAVESDERIGSGFRLTRGATRSSGRRWA